jgi:nitrite reductase (NADH) small subunit
MAAVTTHVVCELAELPPGDRRIIEIDGRSIGVFNVSGTLYAIRNLCPHKGAPLCRGTIGGTMLPSDPQTYVYGLEDRLLRCPWHGWEFDLETGRPPLTSAEVRVRTYRVGVENDHVVIKL